MIKLIASDMDGTFLEDNHFKKDLSYVDKIRELNLDKEFLFASGRATAGIIKMVEKLKMTDMIRYVIGHNGAQIYDLKEQKSLFEEIIEDDIAFGIIRLLLENGYSNPISIHDWDKIYTYNYDKRVDLECNVNFSTCVKIDDISKFPKEKLKIMIFATGKEVDEIHNLILRKYKDYVTSARNLDTLVEVTKKDVNKATALRKFAKIKNINMDEIIAFGNGENDIEMLKEVKIGYAMKNSDKIVLDNIKTVTKFTNNEFGVEKTILELFSKN